jgi:hypothetical protein
MSSVLFSNSELHDHALKHDKLVFEFSITANATPASKVHIVDIPGVEYIRSEGKTSVVDAIESSGLTWVTADDKDGSGDSFFGIFLTNLPSIKKVYKISIVEKTALSTALAATAVTGTTVGLTPDGNIAFNIEATGLDLETESPTIVVEIDYLRN